jgi:hypothetical protein
MWSCQKVGPGRIGDQGVCSPDTLGLIWALVGPFGTQLRHIGGSFGPVWGSFRPIGPHEICEVTCVAVWIKIARRRDHAVSTGLN